MMNGSTNPAGERPSALLLSLLLLAAAPARAEVPQLEGHVTDPQHRLSDGDRKSLNDKLDKLQQETHVDVATWVSNVAPEAADAAGAEFYKARNIGVDWDNGVFFMFPAHGRVHVILNAEHPELTAEEKGKVEAADDPSADLSRRLETLATTTSDVLKPKLNQARPPGQTDTGKGRIYTVAALLVAGLAARRSRRRR